MSEERLKAERLRIWGNAINEIGAAVPQRPTYRPFLPTLAHHHIKRPAWPSGIWTRGFSQSQRLHSGNPLELSLCEVVNALKHGYLEPQSLVKDSAARLREVDKLTNAVEWLNEEGAVEQARALTKPKNSQIEKLPPLWGVPFAHKALAYDGERQSACGSQLADLLNPQVAATALQRLSEAGSINLGQLHMTELAFDPSGVNPQQGDCLNPWDLRYVPGGSSSGSGVALASRAVYGALGSDTGGSIRIPAAICGITGLKQTYGQVSRHGTMELSASHDHVGAMARSAEDCALIYSVIAGQDLNDPSTSLAKTITDKKRRLTSLKGVRIGVPDKFFLEGVDSEIREQLEGSLRVLESSGAALSSVPGFAYEAINALSALMIRVEAGAMHRRAVRTHPERYSNELRKWLDQAGDVPAIWYQEACKFRSDVLALFLDSVMKDVHMLHVPVLRIKTPLVEEARNAGPAADEMRMELTRLTRPFNYLGLPALSVPCGFVSGASGNMLPTAFQLIGHPFDEAEILAVGAFYQELTGWHLEKPQFLKRKEV